MLLAFVLLFFAGRAPGRSCSSMSVSLWRMVGESDLIAVARVVRIEPRPVTFTSMDGEKETVEETDIHLSIQETWKGESPGSVIVSWSDSDLSEGDLLLAVLQSDETLIRGSAGISLVDGAEGLTDEEESWEESLTDEERHFLAVSEAEWRDSIRGRWQPQGDAGLRRVSDSDLPVLSARIREALALQGRGDVPREQVRAWLISMAERRATRSDALLEMMYGEFVGAWQPAGAESWSAIEVLTEEEVARIREGLLAEPSGDEELSLVIHFFEDRRDADFDRAVASAVEGMLARSRADDSTARAVRDAVMRVTSPESPIDVHVTPDVDQLRSVWEEVLQRWGIQRPPAADVPDLPEP